MPHRAILIPEILDAILAKVYSVYYTDVLKYAKLTHQEKERIIRKLTPKPEHKDDERSILGFNNLFLFVATIRSIFIYNCSRVCKLWRLVTIGMLEIIGIHREIYDVIPVQGGIVIPCPWAPVGLIYYLHHKECKTLECCKYQLAAEKNCKYYDGKTRCTHCMFEGKFNFMESGVLCTYVRHLLRP